MHHDFLTLLGFQIQGERTSWVSGAVHKRANSVPGVTEQVFRAVFCAGDSQVDKSVLSSDVSFRDFLGYRPEITANQTLEVPTGNFRSKIFSSSASSSWGALGPALSTQPGDVEGRAALLALVTVVTPGTAHSKTLVKCNFCDMTFSAITSRLAAYSSQKNILSAGVHFC